MCRYSLIYPHVFPVTAYHVNPDKVLALQCNACWNVHYAVSQELNPGHTPTGEDGQCPRALASCLSVE